MSSDSIKHESQNILPNQDYYENKMDNNDDPLIHDTILPHRKRIRKDPLQYVQSQQCFTSCPKVDVSFISFIKNKIQLTL